MPVVGADFLDEVKELPNTCIIRPYLISAMTKRIIITGSNGVIGNVLKKGLSDFDILGLDLPHHDISRLETLSNAIDGHDAIIHLAWNTQRDENYSIDINPLNAKMFSNVYKAALDIGVRRVIVASSVHADDFYNHAGPELLSPHSMPTPTSPYGADKVFMETMGRHFASRGLEVVCIRFGGVFAENTVNRGGEREHDVFLDHADCVSLVRTILEAEKIPGNFSIVYAVSDNEGRVHDVSNPFGWRPVGLGR